MRRTFVHFLILLLCLAGSWISPTAMAEFGSDSATVQVQLLADSTSIPAHPFTAGVLLRMAPGWHTYWMNPGDSGLSVDVQWTLPPGWKAGPLQWPVPEKHEEPGDMITYGYDGELLLMVELTPPPGPLTGEVKLAANVSWLACAKSCVPGRADVALTLPASGEASAANKELFAKFRAKLPKQTAPPFNIRWELHDTEVFLRVSGLRSHSEIDFFPLDPLMGHAETIAPGVLRISLPKDHATDRSNRTVIQGVLVADWAGERTGWQVSNSAPAKPAATATPSATPSPVSDSTPVLSAPRALAFGFLGGFILNLMPCVLPVIALKILGFLGQAGESRRRVFHLGLAFVAGIFAWFLTLALLIVVARAVGQQVNWAFQFQNPSFVLGTMLFLFVFSLNLLGVFEIWLPGTGRIASLSSREGYGGAFLHGVFATLLATPCTAPFLGSALGFALAQSAFLIFAIFTAIAAGMSLPYVLLTAQPGWMRFLPRPGLWMVRFKQAMGFLMLGTVVWLVEVYLSQRGAGGGAGILWLLLGVGAACWIFGTWFTPGTSGIARSMAGLAMAALIALGAVLGRTPPMEKWEPWSAERVAALRKQGKPVFVDFTASWCTNCIYNERFVLAQPPVQEALRSFATLRGDWSKGDPAISAELRRLGRGGVPVYVVFPPGDGAPEVLPELLTEKTVIQALNRGKQ